MRVLIVGGGGREHALAWKCARSPLADTVYVAPGNAGTEREAGVENVAIPADDINALCDFAQRHDVGLTIVGPEAPLVAGIVDTFTARGLKVFGPSADAAQLEGSKSFTKDFLARHSIPTAAYRSFTRLPDALDYLHQHPAPIVVKADGLAAGKGVVLAETREQAIEAATHMLEHNQFGDAGSRIVIEEMLAGEEASFICLVDGDQFVALASSQDHKARDDGDKGPNTGGMGAYSPAPVVTDAVHERIVREVIEPTVAGMAAEGNRFRGFLYAGLMIGPDGRPRVLEYNVRLGDPETQPVLMRLQSDLVALCLAAIDGKLNEAELQWDPRVALGVVMAAGGYPGSYASGERISGLDTDSANVKVFHAGTAVNGGEVVTAGGRVLCVTALGDTVRTANQAAYARVAEINWKDCYYRRDIGYRAIS